MDRAARTIWYAASSYSHATTSCCSPLPRPDVLIVDDVLVNIKYLLEALQETYEVSYAVSGRAAIESAQRNQPQLILLDALMPDMDGFAVCTELRRPTYEVHSHYFCHVTRFTRRRDARA